MAVFINPQSAELEVPPEREPQPQQQSESSAKGGSAEEGDEGQQQWHSPSLSRYENVASSVGPSSRPPELGLWEGEGTEHSATFSPPPLSPIASEHPLVASSCFGRAKHFYHHSPLRYFAPFLLLVLYALLGALLFFWLECDNEKRVLSDERAALNRLRDRTLQRLGRAMGTRARQWQEKETWTRSRGILAEFEQELAHTKSPEALEWNYLGALFYVGTVFTTIGYGNITPRTKPGQALSILYAIVGIPLVLAILNQTSKRMTRWLSERWIRYRQSVRFARKRSKRRDRDLEKGGAERPGEEEDREPLESRTIPVWLALSMVSGYVCAIAGIFLLWESRWSYFTSFYFICISCLTIGLGDVVPDHPYMLIFMFIFVIFGLSCVSMLISVIQIKMEEWLYRMLIRMQKEYQKALQNVSDAGERERIVADLLAKEPWYLRELAPLCISDNQKVKLESLAETYERVLRPTNTKCVQTDVAGEMRDMAAGLSEGEKSRRAKHSGDEEWVSALTRSHSVDSVSDATSLPMDPTSFIGQHLHRLAPSPTPPVLCREAQTELDAPKMEEWTEWRDRQTREAAVGTEARSKESRGTQLRPSASNKGTDTGALIETAERALDPPEWAVGTSRAAQTTQESSRSVQTMFPSEDEEDQQEGVVARHKRLLFSREGRDAMSFETEGTPAESGTQCSPVPVPDVCDIGTQTELSTVDLGAFQSPCQDPEGDDDDEMHFERERSESLAATLGDDPDLEDLLNRAYPERAEKRDLVIQTDDSYLRIARRLDKLRTNRTEINVYCTGAAANSNNKEKPSGARRKSLRFLEPARDMIRDSFRKRSPAIKKQDAGNGGAEGASSAGEGAQAEQRRDTTPPALTPILRRRDSGSSGRVAEFVANHERGIHDPGTPQGRRKARVTVVDEREGRDRERQEEG